VVSVAGSSELALFEVPDVASSVRLATRLATRWNVGVSAGRGDVIVVFAELGHEVQDVARLLREVEAWVADESLCAIRFELDERAYVLEAGGANWSIDGAEAVKGGAGRRRSGLLNALGSVDRAISTLTSHRRNPSTVRGLEDLRRDIVLALRLNDESP
jgi:hypothetical protein